MADRGVHWEADKCQALTSFCCGSILNFTIKNTYLISIPYSFLSDSFSDLDSIRYCVNCVKKKCSYSAKEIRRQFRRDMEKVLGST